MAPRRIHVAVLDTDIPVQQVYVARGLYSSQFRVLLQAAAARLNVSGQMSGGPVEVYTTAYDVVGGVLPPFELLRRRPRASLENKDKAFGSPGPIDAILITGSSASAYELEKYPWIVRLQSFIQTIYTDYPEVKIFGSCFGHQIVAQALLSHHNPLFSEKHDQNTPASINRKGCVSVTACPHGYEVGIYPVTLQPEFMSFFAPLSRLSDGQLRLQLIHGDRVMPLSFSDSAFSNANVNNDTTTTALPAPWLNIGSTAKSPIQGLYYPTRILTYQGHFEFDTFVNRETCLEFARRAGWPAPDVSGYLDTIGLLPEPGKEDDDDSKVTAEIVVIFMAGEDRGRMGPSVSSGAKENAVSQSGLITPPLMEVDERDSEKMITE